MKQLEILGALIYLHKINYIDCSTAELRTWLHSLRNISRDMEREINSRDKKQGLNESIHNSYFVSSN